VAPAGGCWPNQLSLYNPALLRWTALWAGLLQGGALRARRRRLLRWRERKGAARQARDLPAACWLQGWKQHAVVAACWTVPLVLVPLIYMLCAGVEGSVHEEYVRSSVAQCPDQAVARLYAQVREPWQAHGARRRGGRAF
jgi:hypothetical protein